MKLAIMTIMFFVAPPAKDSPPNPITNIRPFNVVTPKKHPPAPTDEIKKLVEQLGSDLFREREDASKALEKKGYAALKACMDATSNTDREIAKRAKKIVDVYFRCFPNIKAPEGSPLFPSIWSLPNDVRFPLGVKITKDEDAASPELGRMMAGTGWCKEMKTKKDVAEYYYRKARKQYNASLKKEELANGWLVQEDQWHDSRVQHLATELFAYDRLYSGDQKKDVIKTLNEAMKLTKTHKNMHRHYAGSSLGGVIPGPLAPKSEVPDRSEYRFNGWGLGMMGFGLNLFGQAKRLPGLAVRAVLND